MRLVALLLSTALALTACGGDDDVSGSPPSSVPSVTAPVASSPTPSPSPSPTVQVTDIRLAVRGGKASTASRRVTVKRGARVRLVVTSDRADEVHVHGYDLFRDVAAGGTATIEFVATIAGQFEVELERGHLKLVELVVT